MSQAEDSCILGSHDSSKTNHLKMLPKTFNIYAASSLGLLDHCQKYEIKRSDKCIFFEKEGVITYKEEVLRKFGVKQFTNRKMIYEKICNIANSKIGNELSIPNLIISHPNHDEIFKYGCLYKSKNEKILVNEKALASALNPDSCHICDYFEDAYTDQVDVVDHYGQKMVFTNKHEYSEKKMYKIAHMYDCDVLCHGDEHNHYRLFAVGETTTFCGIKVPVMFGHILEKMRIVIGEISKRASSGLPLQYDPIKHFCVGENVVDILHTAVFTMQRSKFDLLLDFIILGYTLVGMECGIQFLGEELNSGKLMESQIYHRLTAFNNGGLFKTSVHHLVKFLVLTSGKVGKLKFCAIDEPVKPTAHPGMYPVSRRGPGHHNYGNYLLFDMPMNRELSVGEAVGILDGVEKTIDLNVHLPLSNKLIQMIKLARSERLEKETMDIINDEHIEIVEMKPSKKPLPPIPQGDGVLEHQKRVLIPIIEEEGVEEKTKKIKKPKKKKMKMKKTKIRENVSKNSEKVYRKVSVKRDYDKISIPAVSNPFMGIHPAVVAKEITQLGRYARTLPSNEREEVYADIISKRVYLVKTLNSEEENRKNSGDEFLNENGEKTKIIYLNNGFIDILVNGKKYIPDHKSKQICRWGRNCKFFPKCRFFHPESKE